MIANVIVRVPDVLTERLDLTETAYLAISDALAVLGVAVMEVRTGGEKGAE